MALRLLHISDIHGFLYPLRTARVAAIVCSGDIFPNSGRSQSERLRSEAAFQEQWISSNAERLERWTQGLPFLYCTGNHDYTTGEQQLRDAGVNATCLNDRVVSFDGRQFYGFPWTPAFLGDNWQDKLLVPEMATRIAAIPTVDVLVSHGPIGGILDKDAYGVGFGCPQMASHIGWSDPLPKAYLHGHNHESPGVATFGGMIVSNAATTQTMVEL